MFWRRSLGRRPWATRAGYRQIGKEYGIHPNSVGLWKRQFLEKGPELFAEDSTVQQYERHIANLEQLLGKKEVEIALLKNFLGQNG